MKKLLLVLGVLAVSGMAMAAGARDWVEGTVDVKAKVVQPLEIETEPVDFGIMIPGQTKTVYDGDANYGKVTVIGTAGELIKLEMKGKDDKYVNATTGDKIDVELSIPGATEENQKMTATGMNLFTYGETGDDAKNGIYILEAGGIKEFTVAGEVTAATNQQPGDYRGQIHVRAMYN